MCVKRLCSKLKYKILFLQVHSVTYFLHVYIGDIAGFIHFIINFTNVYVKFNPTIFRAPPIFYSVIIMPAAKGIINYITRRHTHGTTHIETMYRDI